MYQKIYSPDALVLIQPKDTKNFYFTNNKGYVSFLSFSFMTFFRLKQNSFYLHAPIKSFFQKAFYGKITSLYTPLFLQLITTKRLRLKIVGSGYFLAKPTSDSITFYLGHSHLHILVVRFPIFSQLAGRKKKILSLWSSNEVALQNIGLSLHALRSPDIYKGKGIRFLKEKFTLKLGKKKFV
jgi:large subunit ribosomal protein L6